MTDRDDVRQPSTSDPRVGAPRASQTGTVARVGFDDPGLRPLPTDKLDYHVPHPDAHPESHEHSDVPIRPLVWALGSIAALCVVSFVLLYWLFGRYDRQQQAQEVRRTAVPDAKPPVPEPRLEGIPGHSTNPERQDVGALKARYRQELSGWGRGEGGTATVPIERAMDLALERNLFKTGGGGGGAQQGPARPQPANRPVNATPRQGAAR